MIVEYCFDVALPTFQRLGDGRLCFHICVANWPYHAGDTVRFCAVDQHGLPLGRSLWKEITWVQVAGEGLETGYVCLGFGSTPGPWQDPTEDPQEDRP